MTSDPTRCQCWFSINTGPNGECENCGKVKVLPPAEPDPPASPTTEAYQSKPAGERCEGCGCFPVVGVRTTNGHLDLCRLCLDDLNRKSPLLAAAREENADLELRIKASEQSCSETADKLAIVLGRPMDKQTWHVLTTSAPWYAVLDDVADAAREEIERLKRDNADSAYFRRVVYAATENYPRHLAAFLSKEAEAAFQAWWGVLYAAVRDHQAGLAILGEIAAKESNIAELLAERAHLVKVQITLRAELDEKTRHWAEDDRDITELERENERLREAAERMLGDWANVKARDAMRATLLGRTDPEPRPVNGGAT